MCRAQSETPTTGIHNGVVTLYDLEDHTWTYYSGNIAGLRSPDPRNVKITYHAGNVDECTTHRPCVSINEDDSVFVYYKTLEQEGTSGKYPYEVIPNPFSKRPSTVSDGGSKQYYGCRSWRLTEKTDNVTIKNKKETKTYNRGDTINAESAVIFIPIGTFGTNETSIEVEFTANWEPADVVRLTSNSSPSTSGLNKDHEELNFVVINATEPIEAPNLQISKNVTYTMVEPDGQPLVEDDLTTIDHRRTSCYIKGIYKQKGNTKFVYLYINNNIPPEDYLTNNTDEARNYRHAYLGWVGSNQVILYDNEWYYPNLYYSPDGDVIKGNGRRYYSHYINTYCYFNANLKNLTIGRGVSNSNPEQNTIEWITGKKPGESSGAAKYRLRIESGRYSCISFWSGRYGWVYTPSGDEVTRSMGVGVPRNVCPVEFPNGSFSNSNSVSNVAAGNHVNAILGCDYDRADSNNANLNVRSGCIFAWSTGQFKSTNMHDKIFDCYVKSGTFNPYFRRQAAEEVIYIGTYGSSNMTADSTNKNSYGKKQIVVEGGILPGIAGGVGRGDATIRIKGGTVTGSVYGAAEFAAGAIGHRYIIITGGEVNGWIAGGCNGTTGGTDATKGVTSGNTFVYIGGKGRVDSHGNNTAYQSSIGGNVYGAGSGFSTDYKQIGRVTNSTVVIADNGYVERDVYGGGNLGNTLHTANVYIMDNCIIDGNVYGGACENDGENSFINMTGGIVKGSIYGGCNITGNMTQNTVITITGDTVGVATNPGSHVCGGGYGEATAVFGNTTVTIGTDDGGNVIPMIYGDVYGGSDKGFVNGDRSARTLTSKMSTVTMKSGMLTGSLFGGGFGLDALTRGSTVVNLKGGTVQGNVYGGGNGAEVRGNTSVTVGQ